MIKGFVEDIQVGSLVPLYLGDKREKGRKARFVAVEKEEGGAV